ncbi:E3 ubiquitin-protein ligase [Canna indica]|uniref:E3 ubiquitin-protein ligase n=1 Tax=Canna indica TaxID=4628 RepID=A0AAQ3QJN3_9LILI|nr:E3 ubiquitin-protein ligase [Canna indica]
MPAQKRSLPSPPPPPSDDHPAASDDPSPTPLQPQHKQVEMEEAAMAVEEEKQPKNPPQEENGSGEEGGDSESEDDAAYTEESVLVRLADIRKEVQCPICLGIIRKTRTVMECLHRFCRACIDKSMRLGNNECPACRTHCASRRSLRDDPKYDALIAAIYPDIDKYEEEELAFHEEEMSRNKKLQADIAEIYQRQSAALGRKRSTAKATAVAFMKSQGNYRNHVSGRGGRDIMLGASDEEEEEEANVNDVGKNYSSADEPSPERRPKRRKRRGGVPRSSPSRTAGSADAASEENVDYEANREHIGITPLQAGSRDILSWGKNGARSQTRHGYMSGSSGRMVKGGRITKLGDYLRILDDNDDEFDVHISLVPSDKDRVPNLQQSYLCCRPTLSIKHLSEYIARETSIPAKEVHIYVRTYQGGVSAVKPPSSSDVADNDRLVGLQKLEGQESLSTLYTSFASNQGELALIYHQKMQS